jgi:serine/threonine protein kinase
MLGQGTYAVVYKDGQTAIKVARKGDYWIYLAKEVIVLKGLSHPSVIRLADVLMRDESLAFSMEVYDCALFQKMDNLSSRDFAMLMADVCSGLAYIHSAGIVHCDVNPANILVKSDRAALCDFGMARTYPSKEKSEITTPRYRAPEVRFDEQWGCAIDVWAVGICILEFLCGYYNRNIGTVTDEGANTCYGAMFRPLLVGSDPRKIPFKDLAAHFGKVFYMDWPLATIFCRCAGEKRPDAVEIHKELCLFAGRSPSITLASEPFSYNWLRGDRKRLQFILQDFSTDPQDPDVSQSEVFHALA